MRSVVLVVAALVRVTAMLVDPEDPTDPVLRFQSAYDGQAQWDIFQKQYNKTYESTWEKEVRIKIFETNLKYIMEHNELYRKGEKSYYMGVNQFTDLTHQEFLSYYTTNIMISEDERKTYLSPANVQLPTEVDWRNQGYVTAVKGQGKCGSCWAFSATGSIEGQHFKKTGQLVSLSEQQLVDCSTANHGCSGGVMNLAFKYVQNVGGIESEASYPYIAKKQPCQFVKSNVSATVSRHVAIPKGSESKLQEAVATVGPVSVAIDARHRSFMTYKGGIYDEPACTKHLDHGVLVVGYGSAPSDFWIVKNSWGKGWGEDGYIRMSRNKDNQCGIASQASYPLV